MSPRGASMDPHEGMSRGERLLVRAAFVVLLASMALSGTGCGTFLSYPAHPVPEFLDPVTEVPV